MGLYDLKIKVSGYDVLWSPRGRQAIALSTNTTVNVLIILRATLELISMAVECVEYWQEKLHGDGTFDQLRRDVSYAIIFIRSLSRLWK